MGGPERRKPGSRQAQTAQPRHWLRSGVAPA